ncbi:MAG: MaoC family dehydratase [Lachnospiraceae bacterium]|nr:MaoC family dehydratase [Lachnospiraceae bacterium]
MNTYTFDEINIGQISDFTVEVKEEMLDAFKGITGDINPLHNDEEYAKGKGYKGKVVYGMLTASFMSTLAGVYMPGERSLIKEMHIKYTKPVYIGDTLLVTGEVTEMHESFNMIVLKVTIKNQMGEKVLRGSMDIIVQ